MAEGFCFGKNAAQRLLFLAYIYAWARSGLHMGFCKKFKMLEIEVGLACDSHCLVGGSVELASFVRLFLRRIVAVCVD